MAYVDKINVFAQNLTTPTFAGGVVTALGTTTSVGYFVGDRTKLSLMLLGTAITSGNGAFRVDVSNDGTNWVVYNRLNDNLTNTNAQFDTRTSNINIAANAYKMYFFPDGDLFGYVRVRVKKTTDGSYSAVLATVVPGQ